VEANVKLNPLHTGWQRFLGFLFPSESDAWLTVFRIGLGLEVTLYALFLRNDWHNLFASSGKGLVARELGEAITSFESPLIPKFGWLIAVGRTLNISEETVLTVAWVGLLSRAACCCWGCCLGQQRLLRGLSTCVPPKAEGCLPMARTTL